MKKNNDTLPALAASMYLYIHQIKNKSNYYNSTIYTATQSKENDDFYFWDNYLNLKEWLKHDLNEASKCLSMYNIKFS